MNDKNEKNFTLEDIINSIALVRAQEAGLLGNEQIKPEDAGILGALSTDLLDIFNKVLKNEISKEKASIEIKEHTSKAFKALVSNVYDIATNFAVSATKKIPIIGPVLSTTIKVVAERAKKPVVNKIVEAGMKIAKSVEKLFDSLFS
ncbi:hypothetical protein [Calditerrivibrio nitroreducens]|uniref:Uncharacterized protein n=1 Tax=Calditerrivibrio nitroreducens (strain DSM 19672 / NBRC 101217 / Yu37-1) TaxID=768670 RepID=E4TKA3_CALNY|nr:hypothetical protein [Calditerrivibrio nitroreducens]ADR19975.1 hypothetical protein Calni_2083 [Calditerrivibrio nitroreducens DSM 19672]